jgi:hypothetical protein
MQIVATPNVKLKIVNFFLHKISFYRFYRWIMKLARSQGWTVPSKQIKCICCAKKKKVKLGVLRRVLSEKQFVPTASCVSRWELRTDSQVCLLACAFLGFRLRHGFRFNTFPRCNFYDTVAFSWRHVFARLSSSPECRLSREHSFKPLLLPEEFFWRAMPKKRITRDSKSLVGADYRVETFHFRNNSQFLY